MHMALISTGSDPCMQQLTLMLKLVQATVCGWISALCIPGDSERVLLAAVLLPHAPCAVKISTHCFIRGRKPLWAWMTHSRCRAASLLLFMWSAPVQFCTSVESVLHIVISDENCTFSGKSTNAWPHYYYYLCKQAQLESSKSLYLHQVYQPVFLSKLLLSPFIIIFKAEDKTMDFTLQFKKPNKTALNLIETWNLVQSNILAFFLLYLSTQLTTLLGHQWQNINKNQLQDLLANDVSSTLRKLASTNSCISVTLSDTPRITILKLSWIVAFVLTVTQLIDTTSLDWLWPAFWSLSFASWTWNNSKSSLSSSSSCCCH